jgi:hypothetical protein
MAKSINAIGDYEFKVLHLYAGMGGGGLGFKQARYAYKGLAGKSRNILGSGAIAIADMRVKGKRQLEGRLLRGTGYI